MYNINIVLVEPQIPQNTGNISRTCAVTGAKLHLVKPLGFDISDKALKRAGLDYWDKLDVFVYENLDDFFSKNEGNFYYFSTKGQNVYSDIKYPNNSYIIFGREDKGLPEELLYNNQNVCVRIPMKPELRSLNLSNSVAIATYEILRQWNFPELNTQGFLTKYTWR
jgi:tRNA (cytidine/uridine-2'-O-)-methyltransferase